MLNKALFPYYLRHRQAVMGVRKSHICHEVFSYKIDNRGNFISHGCQLVEKAVMVLSKRGKSCHGAVKVKKGYKRGSRSCPGTV